MSDVWPIVHAERQSLADDLSDLSPDQWATRSLCEGWDFHDVLAHLMATAAMNRLKFITLFARAGFNFDRFTANEVNAERGTDPRNTLAAFRAASTCTATPPAPKITRIVEAFVHGEDIRRPLGIAHEYPSARIGSAVEYFTGDACPAVRRASTVSR